MPVLCFSAAVIATTHHTVITSAPGQYPQQPTAVPAQSYQGVQPYPPYQSMAVQPGYGTHSMSPAVHQGPQFTPGPLPTYQEASKCQAAAVSLVLLQTVRVRLSKLKLCTDQRDPIHAVRAARLRFRFLLYWLTVSLKNETAVLLKAKIFMLLLHIFSYCNETTSLFHMNAEQHEHELLIKNEKSG